MVKKITVGDIVMKYLVFGEGSETLVILPGLSIRPVTDQAEAVMTSYARFTARYTVYLFDRRLNLPQGYDIRQAAADTAEVMMALGLGEADVFGTSQGGMMAQYLAIDHPQLVRRLILGSTLSRFPEETEKAGDAWLALARAGRKQALAAAMVDRMCSERMLSLYRQVLIDASAGCSDEELARFIIMYQASSHLNTYDELGRITCPVLMISSKGDKIIPLKSTLEMADRLGCQLILYDESYGHAVYDEAADYKDHMEAFLNQPLPGFHQ